MMRKTKTISVLLAILTAMTLLANFTACQEPVPGGTNVDFEDLVPETYGEWDGNYIYRGNVRSKTTGEEAEYLVESVELDGVSYPVVSCNDYDLESYTAADGFREYSNSIYMTLTVANAEYSNCLVLYNVTRKEYDVLFHKARVYPIPSSQSYYEYEMYNLEKIFVTSPTAGMLINGVRRWYSVDGELAPDGEVAKSLMFVVGENNTIVEESDEYLNYFRASEDYWQKIDYTDGSQKLYARAWGEEPILVYDIKTRNIHTVNTSIVEKNGAVGYLIETWRNKKEGEWSDRFVKLEYFDLKQKKLSTLFESETDRYAEWIAVPTKTCLYLYDNDEFEYKTRDDEGTYTAHKNIAFITLDYSENGVTAQIKRNPWPEGRTYEIEAYYEPGYVCARVNWMASAQGCDGGGYKSEYWSAIDVEYYTSKWRVVKQDEYEQELEDARNAAARMNGVRFKECIYYVRYQRLRNTIIGQARSAYMFQRYTRSPYKTDTMQLWMNGNYTEENEKYCSMMWDYNGSVSNEFIISKN